MLISKIEADIAWYQRSGVIPCERCEGKGSYWNGRGCGGNDPDSWDIDCPECDAIGHHACQHCGCDILVDGFDCIVCDMLRELKPDQLNDDTASQIGKAVVAGIIAIKVHHDRIAQVAA